MAMRDDADFWPKILGLSQCLSQELDAANLPELCFLGIVPGDLLISDYCNKGGMGWVRLVGVNEMAGNSLEGSGYSPCGAELEAQVEVGVMRCAPSLGPDGEPPDVAAQLDAARVQYADMAAMLRAIRCCFGTGRDVHVTTYMPIGPDGGCLGGRWLVSIAQHGSDLNA